MIKKLKEKIKNDKIALLFLKVTCEGDEGEHEKEFLSGEEFEVSKNKRAHWMEYAEQEYETYKGVNENTSPLKERIKDAYHKSITLGKSHYGKKSE